MEEGSSATIVGGPLPEPRKLGRLLKDSWSLFWGHLVDYVLICAAVLIPVGIFQGLVFPDVVGGPGGILAPTPVTAPAGRQVVSSLVLIVSLIFCYFGYLLRVRALIQKPEEKTSSLKAYAEVPRVMLPFLTSFLLFFIFVILAYFVWGVATIIAALLVGAVTAIDNAFVRIIQIPLYIIVFGALILATILGTLLLMSCWAFLANAIVFESLKNWKAIKRAVSLIRFKVWKVMGNSLVIVLINLLLSLAGLLVAALIGFVTGFLPALLHNIIVASLLTIMLNVLTVWQIAFFVYLFLDLKSAKDSAPTIPRVA